MPLFDELITKHGGTYKQFSQIEYIAKNKLDERFKPGVCCALSTIFLSRYGKGAIKDGDDVFAGKTFSQIAADPKFVGIVKQIQLMESSRSDLYKKVIAYSNSGVSQSQQMTAFGDLFGGVGIGKVFHDNVKNLGQKATFLISKPEGEGDQAPFTEIVDTVVTFDARYLFKFPSHYVGAIVDRTRPKFKFFDPNFGQGVFTDVARFKLYLHEFLNHAAVKSSYKLGTIFVSAVSL